VARKKGRQNIVDIIVSTFLLSSLPQVFSFPSLNFMKAKTGGCFGNLSFSAANKQELP